MDTPPEKPYWYEPAPQSEDEVRQRHEDNRLGWNEGAQRYSRELQQTLAMLQSGKSSLHPIERRNLATVGALSEWCGTAIHLQCASGQDTLSLWLEGARRVIGVDISDQHIQNARWLTEQLSAPAAWYRSDIVDTPHELDGAADLVYTGQGALCWLQDLPAWGRVVYRLLKPGGVFHVLDDHPVSWLFDQDTEEIVALGTDYFNHGEAGRGWPETYIGDLDRPITEHSLKHERLWPVSAIFTALRQAGLQIDIFGEYPDEYWNGFPKLRPELKRTFPHSFAILARKPA